MLETRSRTSEHVEDADGFFDNCLRLRSGNKNGRGHEKQAAVKFFLTGDIRDWNALGASPDHIREEPLDVG